MKKFFTLLCFICIASNYCMAQFLWANSSRAWPRGVNNRGIVTDQLGNVYTANSFSGTIDADPGPGVVDVTSQSSYSDVLLSKFDANGSFIWAKSFGGVNDDIPSSIVLDAAGNIYLGGTFQKTVDFDPGPGITSVLADGGNFYTDISDAFVSKFTASGDFVWVRTIGAANIPGDLTPEVIKDLALDDSGNLYVLGKYAGADIDIDPGAGVVTLASAIPNGRNSFLLKLDPNGNYVNGVRVNTGNYKTFPVSIELKNGSIYIATNGDDFRDPGTSAGIADASGVYKFDLGLTLQWSGILGPGITIRGMDINTQEDVYLSGDFNGGRDFDPGPGINIVSPAPAYSSEMFVSKLNTAGIFQWVKSFDFIDARMTAISVHPQTDDVFISCYALSSGYLDNSSNPYSYMFNRFGSNGFVNQMDASGNFKALYPISDPTGTGSGTPKTLYFDQFSNLFVSASSQGQLDFDPSPQSVYMHDATGAYLTKWHIQESVNYYNTKANLGLENPGTWSTTVDGSGPSPVSFSSWGGQFHVINQANATLSGVLSIAGVGSRLVIGDNVNPITLSVPTGNAYIGQTTWVDILNQGKLIMQNNAVPVLKQLANGSYVEFAQSGTSISDTIAIPITKYYDLKLTGGLKNIGLGTTTVANNFIADGVANLGGTIAPNYNYASILECLGNITFLNGTAFEPESALAKQRRISLRVNGNGPVQNITSNSTNIILAELRRTATTACNVVLSPGTNLYLGSAFGGGLSFKSANATFSCTGGSINFRNINAVSESGDQGLINCNGTSFVLSGNRQFNNYFVTYYQPANLRFVPGSTINNLSLSISVTGSYVIDVINMNGNVTVTGELRLENGFINLPVGTNIALTNTATLHSSFNGSDHSFIQGSVSKEGVSNFYFPVGALAFTGDFLTYQYLKKFAPVQVSNLSSVNTFTVNYIKQGYPVRTIDPATIAINPNYGISGYEYWEIAPTTPTTTADLRFYYKDATSAILTPASLGMSHFDGTDWNSIGGVPGVANNTTSGDVFVAGVSTFSPFTFGGTDAVVVPVKLTSFAAKKQQDIVKLTWTTEQEINSHIFIVERSADQRTWNEIARQAAAGNSSATLNYTSADYYPAKGINYYRLKQVDMDGKTYISVTRSLYFGSGNEIVMSPNPAKDIVTVYLPPHTTSGVLQVFTMSGHLVKQWNITSETVSLNVSNLAKGMYIVKLTGEGISESRKLLIE